ncbi:ABC transporter permease [Treponema sp. OMZ 792]|uniref:ABC transporter permease n=1 Tax=unclassified Treponema TaxID=2638727 RepID=UPI0020A2DEEF|nr:MULTISPECIES: ABC transporter permease [unclassified Treponema]UTC75263.1 ABC transporter permease [Treponema sp. OMZ 792]UTC79268.1 ABC transporter permease [Treponema sp. OMZ 798]
MKFFLREIKYYSIDMLHSLDGMFWTLIYPILLSSLFFAVFSAVDNYDRGKIEIGIEKNNPIYMPLQFTGMFNATIIDESDANEMLRTKKIKAFVESDQSLRLSEDGLSQTITKTVIDQIKQIKALDIPINSLEHGKNYIESKNEKMSLTIILFYSLLAMVSIYTMFGSLDIAVKIQGNISKLGARICTTPIKRFYSYLAGIVFYIIFNLTANLIYISFVLFVLKIPFITDFRLTLLLLVYANVFGAVVGLFIGSMSIGDVQSKSMVCVFTSLFLAFLSGLMGPEVKVSLENAIPILGTLNPIAIFTTNLYNINILGEYNAISEFFIVYTIGIIIFLSLSFINSRKVQYDSL